MKRNIQNIQGGCGVAGLEEKSRKQTAGTNDGERKDIKSNRCFSRSVREVVEANPSFQSKTERLVGRKRVFHTEDGYGGWKPIFYDNTRDVTGCPITIPLNQGGTLQFHPNLVDNCEEIKCEIERLVDFRQYKFQSVFPEPRLHALYSSLASDNPDSATVGYKYHNTKMMAKPLSKLPLIAQLAQNLAQKFRIGNHWNIGVDLLVYRDGRDSINWHADDTQGESTILNLVVAAEGDTRTLCIKPKDAPEEGDEQIELYPSVGDGYKMDGKMQEGYLHGILKQRKEVHCKRFAIVFRHGKTVIVEEDSGVPIGNLDPPDRTIQYQFGRMHDSLREGGLYTRTQLCDTKAHRAFHKGVSGNSIQGCDAIIVSRVDAMKEEFDLYWCLRYHATGSQGSEALIQSFRQNLPVRVFRSSNGGSKFRPERLRNPRRDLYRYDGVYQIVNALEETGLAVKGKHPIQLVLVRLEPGMTWLDCINCCSFTDIAPDLEWIIPDGFESMFSSRHQRHHEFWIEEIRKKERGRMHSPI